MDYSELEGGLARMLDRLRETGTATGDPEADAFIRTDANAALVGLLFDQRVRAESAFIAPLRLKERLGHFDLRQIAALDPERCREIFAERPAIHRFTNVMADRLLELARVLVEEYRGDARGLWADGADIAQVEQRARRLPGFGAQKAAKLKYVLHYFGHRIFDAE